MQLKTSKKKSIGNLFFNFLSFLTIIGIIGLIVIFAVIYFNPRISFNPFPPPELPAALILPTSTPTLRSLPPTWTPTAEILPTETATPLPSATPILVVVEGTPSAEATSVISPTETPFNGYYTFALQNPPNAIDSTIFKPDLGCNWSGIGGQVFDLQGSPVKGIGVMVRGTYNGKIIDISSLTLDASSYGPSGYEITLGDKPMNTHQSLYIQLFDQAGLALSDKVYFDTYEDCEKNLLIINFKQVR